MAYYQMGWVDVGDIDTDAGRFYATITIGHVENPGDEPVTTIEGDINPADKSMGRGAPALNQTSLRRICTMMWRSQTHLPLLFRFLTDQNIVRKEPASIIRLPHGW